MNTVSSNEKVLMSVRHVKKYFPVKSQKLFQPPLQVKAVK